MKSLVLIVPETHKSVAEAVSTALGHQAPGDQTYIVGLSAEGTAPATHFGCHAWATDQFIATIAACQAQTSLPSVDWGLVGTTEQDVFAMCAALIVSVREDGQHHGHFNAVLAASGLQKVV